ncbi:MAG: transporter substrate-binding domain-containing protein, partial [Chloroflexi bacterium]|nr:transporter substrate-binding domain-containing protein [Chloroflexota bacterium]
MLVLALVLVACGGGETETVTETVEVEVTRIVEVAGEAAVAVAGGSTLDTVKERGELICGTPQGVSPGFGYIEEDGSYSGFDWEYCRVVAAAVLGDADAVVSRPSTSTERFAILASGEVDMLSRQTTWTLSRDTSLGTNFGPTTFYDGQGMMVRKESGITDLAGLEGGS